MHETVIQQGPTFLHESAPSGQVGGGAGRAVSPQSWPHQYPRCCRLGAGEAPRTMDGSSGLGRGLWPWRF